MSPADDGGDGRRGIRETTSCLGMVVRTIVRIHGAKERTGSPLRH